MASGNRAGRNALLALSLAALLAHAWAYRFLCDDAFIAFRYARNLARGLGLVFNPGTPPVEGYTNFLWVVLLAAGRLLGAAPERTAIPLSLAATVALWALVAWWPFRHGGARPPVWAGVLPAFLLAATREVAVWSTSGLETRLFELLIVAGTLRTLLEIETPSRRPWSGLLFAAATLTRPDGALVGGCVLGTALLLDRPPRARWRAWAWRGAGFVLPVAAHEVFRLAYYGAWLPNTYYAKVGGRTWWDMGFAYAGAFLLEYGAFLWIPLLVLAVRRHARAGTLRVPLAFGAAVLPHALYVVAIGGDHFEYRPLDLMFPFVALLLATGLLEARERAGRLLAAAAAAAVVFGLVWLPLRSHLGYPEDRYRNTFPGGWHEDGAAERWMVPARDPVLGWPPLSAWPAAHRALLVRLSRAAVGLRQEEHALFLSTVRPEGKELAALIASGRVPARLHVALACVGAIPYESDLETLDRLGLTDAVVARLPSIAARRVLAHERRDTAPYEREAGVDLSGFRAAHLLAGPAEPDDLSWIARTVARGGALYAAPVAPGRWLAGFLPVGPAAVAARFPALKFRDLADPAAFSALARDFRTALAARHRREPGDVRVAIALAQAELLTGEAADARALFEGLRATAGDHLSLWTGLAGACAVTGDLAAALRAIDSGIDLARRRGALEDARDFEALRARVRAAQRPDSAR